MCLSFPPLCIIHFVSADIREWVKNTFMGIGLETHEFQYNTDNDRNGDENDSVGIVYGIHRADRTDGKESMVLVVEYTQVAQPAYRTCSPGKEHAQPSGSPPPLSLEFDPDTHSPSGLTLAVGLLSYLSSSRVNWLARDIILVAVENKFNEQKHYHHQQRHHQNYDHRHDEDPPEGCGWKDKIPLFHSREEASVLSQKAVHEWVQAYFHPPPPASSPSPSPSPSFRPTVATGAGASASGLYQRHQRQQIAHAGKMLFAVSLDIPVFTPTFDSVSLHVNGDYGLLPNYDAVSVLIKCLARQKYTVQISDFPPPASTSFPPPASSPSSSPSKPTPPTSAEYVPPFTDMSVFVAPYLHRLLGWLHTHLKDLEPRFIKPETEAKIVESLKGAYIHGMCVIEYVAKIYIYSTVSSLMYVHFHALFGCIIMIYHMLYCPDL